MRNSVKEQAIIKVIENAIKIERMNGAIEAQTDCKGLSSSFDLFTAIEWLMGFDPDPENDAECNLEDVIYSEFVKALESDESAERTAPKFYEIAKGLIKHNTNAPQSRYTNAIEGAVKTFLSEDAAGRCRAIDRLNSKYAAANTLFREDKERATRQATKIKK